MTQPIKSSVIFVMVRPDEGVGFLCTLITGRRLNLCVRFEGPVFTVVFWDIFPIHDLSTNSSFYLILSIAGLRHLTLNALRSPHQSSKIPRVCSSTHLTLQLTAFKGLWAALSWWATLQSCSRAQTPPECFLWLHAPIWFLLPHSKSDTFCFH